MYTRLTPKDYIMRLLPFQQNVDVSNAQQKFLVLNNSGQNYKVNPTCLDDPMDLTNFLLIRSRETLFYHNRVNHADKTFAKGTDRFASDSKKFLEAACSELKAHLPQLIKVFTTDNQEYDLPVAFATNSMYVMAQNHLICKEAFETRLLPLFKKKAANLHSEGIA
jgi:hypothetical protein